MPSGIVESGIKEAPANPFRQALAGWLLGSEAFVKTIKAALSGAGKRDQQPAARRLMSLDPLDVIEAVAAHFGVEASEYRKLPSRAAGRDLAAYLAHRRTTATMRELASSFGLSHPESLNNLIRRAERELRQSPSLRRTIEEIERTLEKTRNQI